MTWFSRQASARDMLREIQDTLTAVNRVSLMLLARMEIMTTSLAALAAQVAKNGDLIASTKDLVAGLRQQILDAGTDPAQLQALTDALAAQDQMLADALVASTPAAPAPAADPAPAPAADPAPDAPPAA